jgi:hypothetical protein
MLDSKLKATERLERTRRELEVASTTRDAVLAREAAVRWSSADYAAWKIDRDAANGEVDRLMSLIADLEAPARQQEQAEREYAIRTRHAAKLKENAGLAVRIRDILSQVNEILLPLLDEVANSEIQDAELNRSLPDDLTPVTSANIIARSLPPLEQREVSRDQILVWVKRGTDFLIEDEGLIEDLGDDKGQYLIGSRFACERKAL